MVKRKENGCVLWLPVLAAGAVLVSMSAQADGPPRFADYPVPAVSTEKVKSIDLRNSKKALNFKTAAREVIGRAPNFAGHYVVITQGCGTSCQAVALVEVTSGKVHVAPFSTALGSEFRTESRLFIDSPTENILEYYDGAIPRDRLFYSYYYEWDESRKEFRLIYRDEPKASNNAPQPTR